MGLNYSPTPKLGSYTAQNAILAGQLAQVSDEGLAYPVIHRDFMAAPGLPKVPYMAPITTVTGSGGAPPPAVNKAGPVQAIDSSGNLYVLTTYDTTGVGLTLNKYFPDPLSTASVAKVDIITTPAPAMAIVKVLSNGNIVVAYGHSSTVYYAVYSPALTTVKSITSVASSNISQFSIAALSGGGFAILTQSGSATSLSIRTYDNSGNAAATSSTFTCSSSAYTCIEQLSNGNLVVSYMNTTVQVAVYSSTPTTPVSGPTNTGITPSSSSVWHPLSVVTGYFAVCADSTSSTYNVQVYSNAGVLQGSNVASTTYTSASNWSPLMNDGVNFWLAYLESGSPSRTAYVKITTAGASTAYSGFPMLASNGYLGSWMGDLGNIYTLMANSSSQWAYGAFSAAGGAVVQLPVASNLGVTQANVTNFLLSPLQLGDDMASFLTCRTSNNTSEVAVIKMLGGSFAGVNIAAVSAGAVATIDNTPGVKSIVRPRGSGIQSLGSILCNATVVLGASANISDKPGCTGVIAALAASTSITYTPKASGTLVVNAASTSNNAITFNGVTVASLSTSGNGANAILIPVAGGVPFTLATGSTGTCVASMLEGSFLA